MDSVAIVSLLIIVICATYQSKLPRQLKEKSVGTLTEVNGGKMNVYTEGKGGILIFMSGGGTPSPLLDFKSLYTRLSKDCQIVVVEKFGYGFSDVLDKKRDLDSILEDTRKALRENKIVPPYTLCPHSMSGIEALYWKQCFPEEVEGIIGLDLATPEVYENYQINQSLLAALSFVSKIGLSVFIPKELMGDAVKHGDLTPEEKKTYKVIFGMRFMSKTMRNEGKEIIANAKKVDIKLNSDIPLLLFVSNAYGTGMDKQRWQSLQKDFCKQHKEAELVMLDCPHYVHNYAYYQISTDIVNWLGRTKTV